jgi:lipoprotein signal peptidase
MNKNKLLKYIKENFTKKLIFLRTIIFLGALAIVLSIVLPLNLYFSKFEENTSIGNGFIYVIIRHNTGLSFSSFENNPTLSIVISSLVCSFVIILLIFQKK